MKTNNNLILVTALLYILMLSACSLMEVEHHYEPNTPFSTFKTYHWIQGLNEDTEQEIDEQMDANIRSEINAQLAKKHFQESLEEKADFLINYRLLTQERSALVKQDAYIRQMNYRYADSLKTERYNYRVGSLILDVIDPKSREVVWQGNVYGFVDVHTDPKKQQGRLEKAVRLLLSKFPP